MENFVFRGILDAKVGEFENGLSNLQQAMALAQTQQDRGFVIMGFANFFCNQRR